MSRARAYALTLVSAYVAEHPPPADFDHEDLERMIQVSTLAVELRWANRSLLESDQHPENA